MIFVILGTQKFQFNRLLIELDRLKELNLIDCEIFAQIGYSDYCPKNYSFKSFLDKSEFNDYISKSDLVITHSGVGSIINSLNLEKKVLVVPRLKRFNEHIDDHQLEIANTFSRKHFVISNGENISDLKKNIDSLKNFDFEKYVSSNLKIQNLILEFIDKE